MSELTITERFQTLMLTRRGYYTIPYIQLSPAAKLYRDDDIEKTNGAHVPAREKRKNKFYFKNGGIHFFSIGRLRFSFCVAKKGK